MPNRIIKESICTNDKVAALKDFEFRLWVGLITQADDAGRGDARPQIIKGRIFPLRESVTIKQIDDALYALASHGLVVLYKVDGKSFYAFPSWAEHQRIRDCKPKYPSPEEADTLPQSAASCGELPQAAAIIQSNPNTNPNPNPNPRWGCVSAPLREALEGFEEMRNKLRKPMTDRARELALKELRKLASDEVAQIAIVEQSIQNGWQSFYPLKTEKKNEKTSYFMNYNQRRYTDAEVRAMAAMVDLGDDDEI